MKYVFHVVCIIYCKINVFVFIYGQTLQILTLNKIYMQHILEWRKYLPRHAREVKVLAWKNVYLQMGAKIISSRVIV
jgi:hypothetical protein